MSNKFSFAMNLQAIMREKGLKPRDIKRELKNNNTPISDSSLSNYISLNESNVRTPGYDVALNIAKAVNVKVSELLGPEFVEHDAKTERMINCGDVSFSKDLDIGSNVEMFKVTDATTEPFTFGDRLIIDKSITEATGGFYLVIIGGFSQVRKVSFLGSEYAVEINGTTKTFTELTIVGKVAARFTTNI